MRNVRVRAILRRVRVIIVAVENKYILYILSASVDLVIQHTQRMRRIV